jgi:hypothetical protein
MAAAHLHTMCILHIYAAFASKLRQTLQAVHSATGIVHVSGDVGPQHLSASDDVWGSRRSGRKWELDISPVYQVVVCVRVYLRRSGYLDPWLARLVIRRIHAAYRSLHLFPCRMHVDIGPPPEGGRAQRRYLNDPPGTTYRATLGYVSASSSQPNPCGARYTPHGRCIKSASVTSSPARYRCAARMRS